MFVSSFCFPMAFLSMLLHVSSFVWRPDAALIDEAGTLGQCNSLVTPSTIDSRDIWQHTVEKSQTNAINATMPLLRQAIWGHILKFTVEKSHTNATNVYMALLMQAIIGHIWKHTVQKSQTNVTNVTLHALIQVLWGHIWKDTVEKSQTNATNNVAMHPYFQAI